MRKSLFLLVIIVLVAFVAAAPVLSQGKPIHSVRGSALLGEPGREHRLTINAWTDEDGAHGKVFVFYSDAKAIYDVTSLDVTDHEAHIQARIRSDNIKVEYNNFKVQDNGPGNLDQVFRKREILPPPDPPYVEVLVLRGNYIVK